MTPEHRNLLGMLANAGRLGPFCVWPNPPTLDPGRNTIRPQLNLGNRPVVADQRPIKFVDPGWVADGWAALEPGTAPNEGCMETPWCPKGWCRGQGDCPWSRLRLPELRQRMEEEMGTPRRRQQVEDEDVEAWLEERDLAAEEREGG